MVAVVSEALSEEDTPFPEGEGRAGEDAPEDEGDALSAPAAPYLFPLKSWNRRKSEKMYAT